MRCATMLTSFRNSDWFKGFRSGEVHSAAGFGARDVHSAGFAWACNIDLFAHSHRKLSRCKMIKRIYRSKQRRTNMQTLYRQIYSVSIHATLLLTCKLVIDAHGVSELPCTARTQSYDHVIALSPGASR
jgi:hypothetical protein